MHEDDALHNALEEAQRFHDARMNENGASVNAGTDPDARQLLAFRAAKQHRAFQLECTPQPRPDTSS